MSGKKIVLTADRSLMTNYRGNYLFGFLACGPYRFETSWAYDSIFCPTVEADSDSGEAKVAQCGLRRIEASLLHSEYKREEVMIAHPNYLEKVIGENTRVVGINAMDPLGMAPVTSTMAPYKEGVASSYVAAKFVELMDKINRLKRRYHFKTVLGGSGAWQFHLRERRARFDLDHIVQGEADVKAPEIFREIEAETQAGADNFPEFSFAMTRSVEEIPLILGPTINSTIEAMRGCGRGCDFCDVNKRKKRDFPIDRLEKEAKINYDYGFENLWLHSDEMLLYGSTDHRNYTPNRDAIVELYEAMRRVGFRLIGTTHMTLSAVCSDPLLIPELSKTNEMGPDTWLAVQPGVETTAPRLVKRHLAYKTKPFQPEEWDNVVREGVRILNQNYYYPALTLIVGLPEEEPDETRITLDTVLALRDSKCIIAPLLYQDYDEKRTMTWDKMNEAQFELFWACWRHNLRQFSSDFVIVNAVRHFNPFMKFFTASLIKIGTWAIFNYLRALAKTNFNKLPEDVIKVAA